MAFSKSNNNHSIDICVFPLIEKKQKYFTFLSIGYEDWVLLSILLKNILSTY